MSPEIAVSLAFVAGIVLGGCVVAAVAIHDAALYRGPAMWTSSWTSGPLEDAENDRAARKGDE